MIQARGLYKDFRLYKKQAGLQGSIKSFFSRSYENKRAVAPLDLDIQRGEIIGLLGPNGAGKTTLMKMLTGIIVPSGGSLQVLGSQPAQRLRSFRKRISLVMGQKSQLWWDLPPMDSFNLIQSYYEIPKLEFTNRLEELSDILGVEQLLNVHVRKLSLGERMKVELMASLLHEPDVLFLDEPTIGLDLISQRNIRDFLFDYHQRKKPTLILTSHYMADIEALCKRVILIIEGEKRFDGKIERFESLLGHNKILTFNFASPIQDLSFFAPFAPSWNHEKTMVEINIPEEELREVASHILSRFPVTDFGTQKTPIERVLETLLHNPALLQDS